MTRFRVVSVAAAALLLSAGAANAALHDYDGFDYSQTAIHGLSGGVGWNGPFVDNDGDYSTALTNDQVSLSSPAFPFTPVGSRVSVAGGEVIRPIGPSSSIATNVEGNVMYLSFLMKKTDMSAETGDYMEVDIVVASGTKQLRMGIAADDMFYIGNNATSAAMKAGPALEGETYYVVGKFLTHAGTTPDELFMNVYGPGDTVPLTEPSTWLLTTSAAYNSAPVNVRIETGSSITTPFAEFDELRIGDTWSGVAVPEPSLMAALTLGALVSARRRRVA